MEPHHEQWEASFEALFPAYLLPGAALATLDEASASRLVARIAGAEFGIDRFRAATFIAAHHDEIAAFALRLLPDLCRSLHGRTYIQWNTSRGTAAGRLDAPQTLLARMRGSPDVVVSRVRTRRFDHPPEVSLRSVVVRLLSALRSVLAREANRSPTWAPDAATWEAALRRTLERTALHRVDAAALDAVSLRVLEGQRHPAYACAHSIASSLLAMLDGDSPDAFARCIARGALWPLERWRRFELAVALSLAQRIEQALREASPGWRVRHTVIDPQRQEIVAFEHPDSRCVRVFYNQSPLKPGTRSEAIAHYFGAVAASRPDVTVTCERPGAPKRAVVIEVKLSDDPSYLHRGFDEATVYAMEYGADLMTRAGSVLVMPRPARGAPRPNDRVVAYGWGEWLEPTLVVREIADAVA